MRWSVTGLRWSFRGAWTVRLVCTRRERNSRNLSWAYLSERPSLTTTISFESPCHGGNNEEKLSLHWQFVMARSRFTSHHAIQVWIFEYTSVFSCSFCMFCFYLLQQVYSSSERSFCCCPLKVKIWIISVIDGWYDIFPLGHNINREKARLMWQLNFRKVSKVPPEGLHLSHQYCRII